MEDIYGICEVMGMLTGLALHGCGLECAILGMLVVLLNSRVQENSITTATDELASNLTENLPQKWHIK